MNTKEGTVIACIDDMLQHADLVMDAINNEMTDYTPDEMYRQFFEDKMQPTAKLPLSSLANSKEDCERIAEMMGKSEISASLTDIERNEANTRLHIEIKESDKQYILHIGDNGVMAFYVNYQLTGTPKALQIAQFINEKYEITKP